MAGIPWKLESCLLIMTMSGVALPTSPGGWGVSIIILALRLRQSNDDRSFYSSDTAVTRFLSVFSL